MEKALLQFRDDEANLVHVGGDHDRRPWLGPGAPLQGDDVAQGIGSYLVRQAGKLLLHDLADLVLVSGDAVGFRKSF